MKTLQILRFSFIALLLIVSALSCESDEVSYILQDVSAPTEVGATFDISQDDTGTVSVTPFATGVTNFQVYFGDVDNETPTSVAPGSTVTHVYAEGEYIVRVVAVGLTGLKSEFAQKITISFTPPTNLDFEVTKNALTVTVAPTAENVTLFEVYFGAVDPEEPVTIMPGETAEYTYPEEGTYTIRVVAKGAGITTIEKSETVSVLASSDPLALPITFDLPTVNYTFTTFNGASYEVVPNPDQSGANTETSDVGAITNSGNNWEGGAFNLGTPVDFSGSNKTIRMKFWAQTSLPVLLKFEGGVNGERQNEVVATHGGTGWEVLTFNFATDATKSYIDGNQGVGEPFVPVGQYATMVIFVDGPGTTSGTFYMDDIEQVAGGGGGTPQIATSLPVDFESNETLTGVFEAGQGVTGKPVANPAPSTANNSSTVYEFKKASGAAWYSGMFQIFPSNIDFSTNKTVSIKFWSPKAGINVRLQLEKEGGGGGPTIFKDQQVSASGEWITLNFDFSGTIAAGAPYDKIVIFPDFNETAQTPGDGSVYYVDDIELTSAGSSSAGGKTSFPINFETPETGGTSAFLVFESDTPPLQVVDNPFPGGINTTSKVAKFTAKLGGANYAGTKTELKTPFTLSSSNSIVKIWVYKSVISNVGIKFEANFASTGEILIPNTKINEWEEITFDFSGKIGEPSSTNIDAIVIFPDFNNRTQDNTVYFDQITLGASGSGGGGTGGNTSREEIGTINFESGGSLSGVFEAGQGVTGKPVANPDPSGINTSATVFEFKKANGAAWYSGIFNIFDKDINLSSKRTFKIKIWSPKAGVNVRFQLEKEGGGGGPNIFVDKTVNTANTWVTLTYNFNGIVDPAQAYDKIVIFPNFDPGAQPPGDGSVYYIDDITQE